MKRALVAIALVTSLGLGVYLNTHLASAGVSTDRYICRSSEDLAAFRALLADPAAAEGLRSLGHSMELRTIHLKPVDAPQEVRCDHAPPGSSTTVFTFTFGDRRGHNSRVFVVDYSVCKSAENVLAVQLLRQKFDSVYTKSSTPAAPDEIGLRACFAAFEEEAFFQALLKALPHGAIADVRVMNMDGGAALGRTRFRVEARAWKSENRFVEPESCASALVSYDPLADTLKVD